MVIKYGCVKLRAVEKTDFEMLLSLINSPEIESKTVGWHFPISRITQEHWMENFQNSDQSIKLIIELENSEIIGLIMLENLDWKNRSATIGCKISTLSKNRIKGDTVDAVKAIVKYAFDELGMNCIYGEILEDNIFSRKLCKKVGFIEEGILRKRVYKGGGFKNLVVLSILRDEFD